MTDLVKIEPAYLGDGVYASFDGWHINLAVNHHENHAVALEPSVLEALNAYAKRIRDAYAKADDGDAS